MFRFHAVLGLGLILSAGTVAGVEAAEIETARGPVTIAAVPVKLAVFDMAAADTLDALGVPIAGLPDKLYVSGLDHLSARAERVGTIFEPDLEALSALGPDLIVVGSRSAPKLDAVSQVAPAIDMSIGSANLLEDGAKRLAAYGTLFSRQEQAAVLAQKLDAAVDAARAAIRGKGKGLIVMTNGPKVSAFGTNSRFGWVHTALGLPPAVETMDVAIHGEAVSFEFIRDANPDWLIVFDRAAAVGSGEQNWKATLDNELVHDTRAWRKGQIIALPPSDFYIAAGGVQSTLRVLGTITTAFAGAATAGE